MKIALVGDNYQDISLTAKIKKILDNLNIPTISMTEKNYDVANQVDLVLIAGGDRAMLDYFHKVETDSSPALGIYESESTGFLAQIDVRNLEDILPRLNKGDFSIDELVRLAVKVDGKEIEPVLNDVVVFPSKSATLMEYVLRIDNKDVWHDNSDGVIVSTPTGSTAYSMSAGGPMVLQNSPVFIVVSVNSVDNTRRPLIVPDESRIEISDILSRFHGEVVLDGGRRIGIKKILECTKHSHGAKLVRLIGEDSTTTLIAKKIKIAEELLNMPPSAKLILKILEYEGAMSQKDLASKTLLPERTIRLSLGHLLNRGYVKKKTSLRDARQRIYELKI
ncbi:MAG: sugar kinase [Nitrososphaeraceae archaeon]|nr:sugar kinase [Nitrososphaeraceae archaeon]